MLIQIPLDDKIRKVGEFPRITISVYPITKENEVSGNKGKILRQKNMTFLIHVIRNLSSNLFLQINILKSCKLQFI